jgi:hypothetical protein
LRDNGLLARLRKTCIRLLLRGGEGDTEKRNSSTHLRHPNLPQRSLRPLGMFINHHRRRQHQQPRLVDLDPALGKITNDGSVLEEGLAKGCFAGVGRAEEGQVEGAGGEAEGTHAVFSSGSCQYAVFPSSLASNDDGGTKEVEERERVPVVKTTGTETTLDDLEPASPAKDEVVERDADVLVEDLEVAFRGVVVAELSIVGVGQCRVECEGRMRWRKRKRRTRRRMKGE